ncbi:MAG TPA: hypothetical protein VMU69_08810 [Bradyrhizobium sp.]|nr:hypothetical protein [Bradyrhizobium sp.]
MVCLAVVVEALDTAVRLAGKLASRRQYRISEKRRSIDIYQHAHDAAPAIIRPHLIFAPFVLAAKQIDNGIKLFEHQIALFKFPSVKWHDALHTTLVLASTQRDNRFFGARRQNRLSRFD